MLGQKIEDLWDIRGEKFENMKVSVRLITLSEIKWRYHFKGHIRRYLAAVSKQDRLA